MPGCPLAGASPSFMLACVRSSRLPRGLFDGYLEMLF